MAVELHELYSAHETSAVKAVREQVATPDLTDELSQGKAGRHNVAYTMTLIQRTSTIAAQALLADLEAVNATQAGLIHTLTEERQTLADQIDQLRDSQTKASDTHLQTYTRLSKSLGKPGRDSVLVAAMTDLSLLCIAGLSGHADGGR